MPVKTGGYCRIGDLKKERAQAGKRTARVLNPGPGGGFPDAKTFTIA